MAALTLHLIKHNGPTPADVTAPQTIADFRNFTLDFKQLGFCASPVFLQTLRSLPKKSPVSCLNDYRPIALTPIMMKCFERLVMHNIKTSLPNTLDPLQFAYRPNRSTDDAISSTLHLALTHLENKDSYVRMLFIDFSSAFNTIIPQQLINKLNLLGLNTSLCNWILDFLTERPQSVRVGHNTSSTTTLSTGAPRGCAKFSSNHIIKFADDTTVVGLISNNDETHYREEVAQLAKWCGANNLSLNVSKTKEVVMDFRRNSVDHPPLTIDSSTVERVSSTKFLGVHITEDLTWTTNTMSLSKKAQQRLHFLRRLKRASLPPPILTTFYRGTIESVLTSCITVWYGNCSAADRKTTFSYPISSFQSTLHLICFDTALCKQPPHSVMTFCDLSSLWRVSIIVFWTIVMSAVFPIIVVSKNKRMRKHWFSVGSLATQA
ncbi:hypothetical protein M9458_021032 [Cirrhinus mrigala]|uniref:Reverse transcriptase domain-containing protein n=1 Tax=Cirrhinus mrigala TaxID=683832 RepID=A0ABD0QHN7_CIRMR